MTTHADTTSAATWVAIDIAKHHHAVLIETPDGKHQRFRMASTLQDHQRLIDRLRTLPAPTRVAMEPTGDYHRTLAYRLLREGFDVCLVSSVAGARYREAMFNSWDKNDPKDAGVILALLKQGITQRYVDPLQAGHHGLQCQNGVRFTFRQVRKATTHRLPRLGMLPQRRTRTDSLAMARQPRLDLPGIPQHVVQRGNNRLPCFLDDADRRRYLTLLGEALLETGCILHAYVLMDNHVHLLMTPPESGAISRLMQKLGRGYVGQFNIRHRRTGTLWEGRYKACLVDNESYVLRCHRYIDLNPVRARMIDDPTAFPWSSCAHHCGQHIDATLTPHPAYTAIGPSPEARAEAYRHLLHETLSDDDLTTIRTYLQQQRALGLDDFRAMVEAKTRRFAGVRPAHRPPHKDSNACK